MRAVATRRQSGTAPVSGYRPQSERKVGMTRRLIFCIAALAGSFLPVVASAAPSQAPPPIHQPAGTTWFAPIAKLGPNAWRFFTCVIYAESRSTWAHPHTVDVAGDQYGIFQISIGARIWQAYVLPFFHVALQTANAYQQAVGAALIYRVDGTYPWARFDGC